MYNKYKGSAIILGVITINNNARMLVMLATTVNREDIINNREDINNNREDIINNRVDINNNKVDNKGIRVNRGTMVRAKRNWKYSLEVYLIVANLMI